MAESIKDIAATLLGAKSVLILTHARPDGDALGSSFGMRQWLRDRGIEAEVFLLDAPPKRYSNLCRGYISTFPDFDKFDRILVLDCANFNRIGFPDLDAIPLDKLCNVDHHVSNSICGKDNFVDDNASSCCEIAAKIATFDEATLSKECATLLLLGIITDTGSFRFSNTGSGALRIAAQLIDAGADLETLVNAAYFSDTFDQLKMEAEVTNQIKLAFSGRLAYAFLSDELLEKYHFDLKESENVIDLLRRIDTVTIAILIYKRDDNFKLSLRSKDSRFPVLGIARKFNGGGHLLAGGATICAKDFAEVERAMLEAVGEVLGK